MTELTIYWKTKNAETISRIRKRFGLSYVTTVNGETFARIEDADMPLLRETERRGFVELRNKRLKKMNGYDRE